MSNYPYNKDVFKLIILTETPLTGADGSWNSPSNVKVMIEKALKNNGMDDLHLPDIYSLCYSGNYEKYVEDIWDLNKGKFIVSEPQLPALPQNAGSLEKLQWKLAQVGKELSLQKIMVETAIKKIGEAQPVIDVKRRWYGAIDKNSVEKSIFDVFDASHSMVKMCGAGITSLAKNLGSTFELIKLICRIDEDIYSNLANDAHSDNEFRQRLGERLDMMTDASEEVKEILEISYGKMSRLKEIINDLESGLTAKIDRNSETMRKALGEIKNRIAEIEALKPTVDEMRETLGRLKSDSDKARKEIDQIAQRQEELLSLRQKVSDLERSSLNLENKYRYQQKCMIGAAIAAILGMAISIAALAI